MEAAAAELHGNSLVITAVILTGPTFNLLRSYLCLLLLMLKGGTPRVAFNSYPTLMIGSRSTGADHCRWSMSFPQQQIMLINQTLNVCGILAL